MGFFYFDESIHDRAGFILGAWVYSQSDLTPVVNKAIAEAGLQLGMHEFKSGARMDSGETQRVLRDKLKQGLQETRLGVVVVPVSALRSYERGAQRREHCAHS
jgi:hypothetical protein